MGMVAAPVEQHSIVILKVQMLMLLLMLKLMLMTNMALILISFPA